MELSWHLIHKHDSQTISGFADQLNVSPILAKVLLNRGVEDAESARRFYKSDLNHLHDPFLLSGMQNAVRRVEEAISK